MAGDSAPSAPQPSPSASANAQNLAAIAQSEHAPAQTAPDAAPAPVTDPSTPSKGGKAKKDKPKAAAAPSPERPVRATRSASALALDADQLRLEQFGSRQDDISTRQQTVEKRLNKIENDIARFKVDVSTKTSAAADDSRIRDVETRARALERTVKDISLARVATDNQAVAIQSRVASLESHVQLVPDLDGRVNNVEGVAANARATAEAAMVDINEIHRSLETIESSAVTDWNAFVEFRDNTSGRLRDIEKRLQDIENRVVAATPAPQPRAPSPIRRIGRHARDDDTDPEDVNRKKTRRESGAERHAASTPVPPEDVDLPTVWPDGGFGEETWVSCRIGQPQRTANVHAFTWHADNDQNLSLVQALCENLASLTGSCPTPTKCFTRDGETNKIWRYFQFSSRENFLRFMTFWRTRPAAYSSLRAIPVGDVDNVASIADLMRSQRASQDRRRDGPALRDRRRA